MSINSKNMTLVKKDMTSVEKDMTSVAEIKEKYLEYTRIYQRLQRNGDLEQKKVGRKPVSPEHKKATYERWIQKRKDQRRETAIAEGRIYARGRPTKIQSENLTCVQV